MQQQWTVEADGDAAPLTVAMQVTQVTVATANGDQITLVPEQVAPLVHRLDCIYDDLTCTKDSEQLSASRTQQESCRGCPGQHCC